MSFGSSSLKQPSVFPRHAAAGLCSHSRASVLAARWSDSARANIRSSPPTGTSPPTPASPAQKGAPKPNMLTPGHLRVAICSLTSSSMPRPDGSTPFPPFQAALGHGPSDGSRSEFVGALRKADARHVESGRAGSPRQGAFERGAVPAVPGDGSKHVDI